MFQNTGKQIQEASGGLETALAIAVYRNYSPDIY
jgi:hypothetical protein